MNRTTVAVFALLLALGCGEKGPDPKVEADRMSGVKEIRAIYDKVGGKWDSLTPDDKAAYLKSFGGNEENGKRMWDSMNSMSSPSAPRPPEAPSGP